MAAPSSGRGDGERPHVQAGDYDWQDWSFTWDSLDVDRH